MCTPGAEGQIVLVTSRGQQQHRTDPEYREALGSTALKYYHSHIRIHSILPQTLFMKCYNWATKLSDSSWTS